MSANARRLSAMKGCVDGFCHAGNRAPIVFAEVVGLVFPAVVKQRADVEYHIAKVVEVEIVFFGQAWRRCWKNVREISECVKSIRERVKRIS